jgi:hypothetical protein
MTRRCASRPAAIPAIVTIREIGLVKRVPSDVMTDGFKELQFAPDRETEPRGERSSRDESYPNHPGTQGETGRRESVSNSTIKSISTTLAEPSGW